MPKVSIILPIYNVEQYLRECLDSIINQTLKEIEIICVNDGSTDNSLEILKEYAQKDSRIKIIDKSNSGYGHSMNMGIDAATGEYLGIVEPDDYVMLDMYETLYNKAVENNLDFIKADFKRFLGEKDNRTFIYEKLDNKNKYYNQVLNPQENIDLFKLAMNTWSGIYKLEFLNKNHIRHNETPGASFQDNGFWFQTFALAQRVYFIDKPFYMNRRDNINSSVKNKEKIYCMKHEYDFILAFLNKYPELKEKLMYIYQYIKYNCYIFTFRRIDEQFKREFLELFSKEFKQAEDNHEIDYKLFNGLNKKKLKLIINNPDRFYQINVGSIPFLKKTLLKLKTILKKYPIKLSLKERLLLCKYLKKSDSYLEFGAGGSTFLALLHSKTKIYSVESDKNWINYLRKWKIITKAEEFQKLIFNYVDIGKTKECGFPVDDTEKDKFPDYSKAVFEKYSNIKFDTVFIDGRFRVACTLAAILNTSLNSIIILHDYANRKGYHIIERFLDKIESANAMVVFRKKNNINLAEVNQLYEEYKYIAD